MTAQAGQQIITILILSNISKSKTNAENDLRRLVPDQFLFFKKALFNLNFRLFSGKIFISL